MKKIYGINDDVSIGNGVSGMRSAPGKIAKTQRLANTMSSGLQPASVNASLTNLASGVGQSKDPWMASQSLESALLGKNSLYPPLESRGQDTQVPPLTTVPNRNEQRQGDDLDRVHLESKSDNSFIANRWENLDGSQTGYAEAFDEELKKELKKEFGEPITRQQALELIDEADKRGDAMLAADYRKKLFRANQYAIVAALDVDKKTDDDKVSGSNALNRQFTSSSNHEMYGKTTGLTYCNIYAYDVVTAMGAYLPRVWWTEPYEKKALEAMSNGEAFTTKPVYNITVEEMNANALNAWFPRIGGHFNWEQAGSMEEAQNAANDGNVVVLVAANKSAKESGHIAVILAERDQLNAKREAGEVDIPLTSQAGGTNWKHAVGNKWWENSSHKDGAAWIHRGVIDSPLASPEEMGTTAEVPETDKTIETDGGARTAEIAAPIRSLRPTVLPSDAGDDLRRTGPKDLAVEESDEVISGERQRSTVRVGSTLLFGGFRSQVTCRASSVTPSSIVDPRLQSTRVLLGLNSKLKRSPDAHKKLVPFPSHRNLRNAVVRTHGMPIR